MHSIIRDEHGRLVPLVRPKSWQPASLQRSRERSDRIARVREDRRKWAANTQLLNELDRSAVAQLEEGGIAWAAVQRWLDEAGPRQVFAARLVVKQTLQVLADQKATARERIAAHNELYRRLIAAGILD